MAKELGHLFCYYRSYKTLGPYSLESVVTLQEVIQECITIQLIACRWDTACISACILSSPDPSLFLRKWVWLARLILSIYPFPGICVRVPACESNIFTGVHHSHPTYYLKKKRVWLNRPGHERLLDDCYGHLPISI